MDMELGFLIKTLPQGGKELLYYMEDVSNHKQQKTTYLLLHRFQIRR